MCKDSREVPLYQETLFMKRKQGKLFTLSNAAAAVWKLYRVMGEVQSLSSLVQASVSVIMIISLFVERLVT